MIPHGYCLLYDPWLLWTMVVADALIALSYFAIPVQLVFEVRRSRGPIRWPLLLFAGFILLCGVGHVIDIYVIWDPIYWTQALEHAATGLASAATAIWLHVAVTPGLRRRLMGVARAPAVQWRITRAASNIHIAMTDACAVTTVTTVDREGARHLIRELVTAVL